MFCRWAVRVQTTCSAFLFQSNLSRKVIVLSSEQQSTIVLRSRVRGGSVDMALDIVNQISFQRFISVQIVNYVSSMYYEGDDNCEG